MPRSATRSLWVWAIPVSCAAWVGSAAGQPPQPDQSRPTRFSEFLISSDYTYPFGIAAAGIDEDGDLDLTSADALPHHNLYWFENDGKGNFA